MSEISLWEAMKKIERLNPQWVYEEKYGYGYLSFNTTTPDGPVSVLIEKGYECTGSSSPITNRDGFRLTITLNGRAIFRALYDIEYRSGWFGGDPKPHYSREYIYLKNYLAPFEDKERAKRAEEERLKIEARRADVRKIQVERERFFRS